ncbi:MAG: hypothetical protein ACK4E0_19045 [Chitinophagaceae bacterium]
MTRRKLFLTTPLAIAAGILIYCWDVILSTDYVATWRHYVGLASFLMLIFFYFRSYKLTIIGTGIYFLLAAFNLLSMTAEITTSSFRIGSIETPPVQMLSLGLFILFAILNINPLTDIYLEYKEAKQSEPK